MISVFRNRRAVVYQFSKFAVVGFFGTMVHLLFLYLFTESFGIYYMISSALAFILAVTHNFFFNKFWTFRKTSKGKTRKRYAKFFLVAVVAFIVNVLILYIVTEYFKIYYMFSQIIAIAFSLWINFLGNKKWTFKR